ncbi:MAG: hypothetical protein ACOVP1_05315 [Bacteroidia bacterium]
MILAPFVAFKASYEWIRIKFLHEKPLYPFGKDWLHKAEMPDIEYLANYEHQMLSIALVCLGIAIIAYIAVLIKALIRLVWLALLMSICYFVFLNLR